MLMEVDKCLEEINFERPFGVASRIDEVALQLSQNSKDVSESVRISGIKTKKKTYKSSKWPKYALERATKRRRKVSNFDKNSGESVQSLLTQSSQHTHIAHIPYSNIFQLNASIISILKENPERATSKLKDLSLRLLQMEIDKDLWKVEVADVALNMDATLLHEDLVRMKFLSIVTN
ncbi:hypothetical protein M9H77_29500 [Catharanthus roseus]|uniref:Uncharacterized protein n=1 Tax=Catharanthus roseus TaxID=4058 RepID=A0ACB9ZYU4_CATRO|nr:hypothetical protein M9H77_29500 [Catharanthus roseus]